MKTKVLISDDQADIRRLVGLMLESGDIEVYEASTEGIMRNSVLKNY